MAINNQCNALKAQMEEEIRQYLTEQVEIGDGHLFSQHKLVRRISLFENHIYPTGKFDSQGNYKFWYDIITPRIDSEVKNIDFDTRDVSCYSERKIDALAIIITNLKLGEYMRTTGQAEEFNGAVEEFSGWGNAVWKKVKKSYERMDLRNFYVINQTARSLRESPVIERHQMIQSDLREKANVWDNIEVVIEGCGSETYKAAIENAERKTTVPYYEIYERNGEVCLKDLKETRGETVEIGDEKKYVFARVVAAGTKGSGGGVDIKYILFADAMPGKDNSKIYKEAHRGRYKGRWWREGLYELLFDIQVRANQIGNQLAQGLEFASKTVFASEDKLLINNILTDLKNGDVIRAKGLQHVEVRMNGFDQLINEWNRLVQIANEIANSREVVMGDSLPAGTAFRLGALYNQNANKLFDFLREKLAVPFSQIFEEWIVPELVKELDAKEVLRITGDSDMLMRLADLVVQEWYIRHLIDIGPHSPEDAIFLKSQKLQELLSRPEFLIAELRDTFKNFHPNVTVEITGENSRKSTEMESLASFITLEMDPVRRSHMIEMAMKRVGMDVGSLPRMTPQQLAPQGPAKETPAPTV